MSLDDMTGTRTEIPTPPAAPPVTSRAGGEAVWIEPWLFAPRTRPRSPYRDAENGRSASRPPEVRQGD
jgi:hypothetical protein